MHILTLDFETYFDDDYSLSKLTTEEYIRDPRFEVLGCAFYFNGVGRWVDGKELSNVFAEIDWSGIAVLCHHAHFDGLILQHRYGVRPAYWLDTLSMARYVHGNHIGNSLESLSNYYGFTPKNVPYALFKGKHWNEIPEPHRQLIANSACHDCELTRQLFDELAKQFPEVEYPIVDITIRMFTEPRLVGDQRLLLDVQQKEIQDKQALLDALGVTKKELGSNETFANLLRAEGIEIEYKPGKNGPIPAFAKTDSFMRALQNSENETVSALADARLSIKSSIVETRSKRIYDMSTRGPLAVYLYYSGAHTRRWSGGDATNFQNLNRGSAIRRGIRAPEGFLLAKPDQAQGECRILNWFAGQLDVVERFRQGADPYIGIASKFYGFEVTKEHPAERGTGKQLELSCGFGSGAETIVRTAARGQYGPPVYLSAEDGLRARDLYRREHQAVVRLWQVAGDILSWLAARRTFDWNILHGEGGRLFHPSGNWLDYTGLRWDADAREWKLASRYGEVRTYGPKLVENVVQWLSRIVTSEAMATLRAYDYPIVGMSHDDIWLLIPKNSDIEAHRKFIEATMSGEPSWAPGLPLASECDIGETYK